MSFIRAKEIPPGSGRWYDYEVEDYREGEHVKQRVIRYIGRSGKIGTTSGGGQLNPVQHDTINIGTTPTDKPLPRPSVPTEVQPKQPIGTTERIKQFSQFTPDKKSEYELMERFIEKIYLDAGVPAQQAKWNARSRASHIHDNTPYDFTLREKNKPFIVNIQAVEDDATEIIERGRKPKPVNWVDTLTKEQVKDVAEAIRQVEHPL
jgi:hypothetical protein